MQPGPARRRAARGRRAGDRLRAGRQRQHRRAATRCCRSSPPRARPARGCTSTAPSACGPPPRRGWRRWWPAPTAPTRGRSTRTSGSTCPTTAASRSSPTARRTRPRCPPPRSTCWRATTGSPRRPRCRAAAARSRSTPRCATSGARGLADLVERCCDARDPPRGRDGARRGRRGAQRRRAQPGAAALRRRRRATARVIEELQRGGEAWLGGTVWHGMTAARVAFSNWSTDRRRRRPPRGCAPGRAGGRPHRLARSLAWPRL